MNEPIRLYLPEITVLAKSCFSNEISLRLPERDLKNHQNYYHQLNSTRAIIQSLNRQTLRDCKKVTRYVRKAMPAI